MEFLFASQLDFLTGTGTCPGTGIGKEVPPRALAGTGTGMEMESQTPTGVAIFRPVAAACVHMYVRSIILPSVSPCMNIIQGSRERSYLDHHHLYTPYSLDL